MFLGSCTFLEVTYFSKEYHSTVFIKKLTHFSKELLLFKEITILE